MNRLSLTYQEYGDKNNPLMLFLHGGGVSSTGIIIPKVGHGISLLDPDFFNQMIENWIQEGAYPKR